MLYSTAMHEPGSQLLPKSAKWRKCGTMITFCTKTASLSLFPIMPGMKFISVLHDNPIVVSWELPASDSLSYNFESRVLNIIHVVLKALSHFGAKLSPSINEKQLIQPGELESSYVWKGMRGKSRWGLLRWERKRAQVSVGNQRMYPHYVRSNFYGKQKNSLTNET